MKKQMEGRMTAGSDYTGLVVCNHGDTQVLLLKVRRVAKFLSHTFFSYPPLGPTPISRTMVPETLFCCMLWLSPFIPIQPSTLVQKSHKSQWREPCMCGHLFITDAGRGLGDPCSGGIGASSRGRTHTSEIYGISCAWEYLFKQLCTFLT